MASKAEGILKELRNTVQNAKSVPMSASCMLNRNETLETLDQLGEALKSDIREAERVMATSLETLQRAQEEAEQIIKNAEERAKYLAGETQVMNEAIKRAADTEAKAEREAKALRRETDTFVDQRIATFEAALISTLNQIRTMRSKLSDRSKLDEENSEPLPDLNQYGDIAK
ncbi:MAG: hypothetical protein LBR20_07760 [Propionibacteriaceae bacterium]|jgi:cell division septum initiation protein DivIVA|nr:hypothetical protein [Propionibacteriaceae bacterium]